MQNLDDRRCHKFNYLDFEFRMAARSGFGTKLWDGVEMCPSKIQYDSGGAYIGKPIFDNSFDLTTSEVCFVALCHA